MIEKKHKPLEMPKNRDAFLARAMSEGDGCLSAVGLAYELTESGAGTGAEANRFSLARLVELSRRKLRLSLEELASRADVDVAEVLAIEKGDDVRAEPRTFQRLADVFKLNVDALLQLAGLVKSRQSSRIGHAAVRFAARSEPMAELTPEEERALKEFVEELSKA